MTDLEEAKKYAQQYAKEILELSNQFANTTNVDKRRKIAAKMTTAYNNLYAIPNLYSSHTGLTKQEVEEAIKDSKQMCDDIITSINNAVMIEEGTYEEYKLSEVKDYAGGLWNTALELALKFNSMPVEELKQTKPKIEAIYNKLITYYNSFTDEFYKDKALKIVQQYINDTKGCISSLDNLIALRESTAALNGEYKVKRDLEVQNKIQEAKDKIDKIILNAKVLSASTGNGAGELIIETALKGLKNLKDELSKIPNSYTADNIIYNAVKDYTESQLNVIEGYENNINKRKKELEEQIGKPIDKEEPSSQEERGQVEPQQNTDSKTPQSDQPTKVIIDGNAEKKQEENKNLVVDLRTKVEALNKKVASYEEQGLTGSLDDLLKAAKNVSGAIQEIKTLQGQYNSKTEIGIECLWILNSYYEMFTKTYNYLNEEYENRKKMGLTFDSLEYKGILAQINELNEEINFVYSKEEPKVKKLESDKFNSLVQSLTTLKNSLERIKLDYTPAKDAPDTAARSSLCAAAAAAITNAQQKIDELYSKYAPKSYNEKDIDLDSVLTELYNFNEKIDELYAQAQGADPQKIKDITDRLNDLYNQLDIYKSKYWVRYSNANIDKKVEIESEITKSQSNIKSIIKEINNVPTPSATTFDLDEVTKDIDEKIEKADDLANDALNADGTKRDTIINELEELKGDVEGIKNEYYPENNDDPDIKAKADVTEKADEAIAKIDIFRNVVASPELEGIESFPEWGEKIKFKNEIERDKYLLEYTEDIKLYIQSQFQIDCSCVKEEILKEDAETSKLHKTILSNLAISAPGYTNIWSTIYNENLKDYLDLKADYKDLCEKYAKTTKTSQKESINEKIYKLSENALELSNESKEFWWKNYILKEQLIPWHNQALNIEKSKEYTPNDSSDKPSETTPAPDDTKSTTGGGENNSENGNAKDGQTGGSENIDSSKNVEDKKGPINPIGTVENPDENNELTNPDLINSTDPRVYLDPTYTKDVIAVVLQENAAPSDLQAMSGKETESDPILTEGVLIPIVQINNTKFEASDLVEVHIESTDVYPTASVTINDRDGRMSNFDISGMSSRMVIIITSPEQSPYKKMVLTFYVNSTVKGENNHITYYGVFWPWSDDSNRIQGESTEQTTEQNKKLGVYQLHSPANFGSLSFPGCEITKKYEGSEEIIVTPKAAKTGALTIWETGYTIANMLGLGFAANEHLESAGNSKSRILSGKTFMDMLKDEAAQVNSDSSKIETWIDLHGYIVLSDTEYVMNAQVNPNELMIQGAIGPQQTDHHNPSQTYEKIPRVLTNSNDQTVINNMAIEDDINSESSVYNTVYSGTHQTLYTIENYGISNVIKPREIQVKENSVSGQNTDAYNVEIKAYRGICMNGGANNFWYNSANKAYFAKLRSKPLVVTLKQANFGLERGTLITLAHYCYGENAKSVILTHLRDEIINWNEVKEKAEGLVNSESTNPGEDTKNNTDSESINTFEDGERLNRIQIIMDHNIGIPNPELTGLYYIDGITIDWNSHRQEYVQKLRLLRKSNNDDILNNLLSKAKNAFTNIYSND